MGLANNDLSLFFFLNLEFSEVDLSIHAQRRPGFPLRWGSPGLLYERFTEFGLFIDVLQACNII